MISWAMFTTNPFLLVHMERRIQKDERPRAGFLTCGDPTSALPILFTRDYRAPG